MYAMKENLNEKEYEKIVLRINEQLDRLDIMTWNNVQKDIWLHLVKDHIVQYSDMDMFFKMGQVFSDYFDKTKTAIAYPDLVQSIMNY